jgi:Xaa-Pro aminopeptidase
VLTSALERERVAAALPDAEVLDYVAFGFRELVTGGMSWNEAERKAVARAVRHIGIGEAVVPGDLPLALGDRLRADGVVLHVDDGAVELRRRAKSPVELEGIRAAQRAAEAGMAAAAALLARARPGAEGRLELDGRLLLAEDVRATLRSACAAHGAPCPPDVIVASVWQGTGHEPGTGPLPAGLPIQVDLWPQDEPSGCWADMARTFVIGTPPPEVAEQERLVRTALEQAQAAVRPGVTGRALHDAACDLFEAAGYATQRTDQSGEDPDGFQWSLGHGVGLDPHEAPSVGLAGHEPLVAGDVLAIEPGLWDRRFGGISLEDLVLVTETGGELLTRFPYDLTPRG